MGIIRRQELLMFSGAFLAELLFGLLMVLTWGTAFCSGDAIYHQYIPRLVAETGDLRHLGVLWPPFLHVLLIPLVRHDFLYTTGLAGTVVSALATGLACVFLYRLVGDGEPGLAAPFVLMCNVFTLIHGATSMMEQWAMAFLLAAAYYLRRYLASGRAADFLKCSAAFCLGCLTRYEVWPPAALVVLTCLIKEARSGRRARLLLSPLPLLGSASWLGWNYYLTGDPLMFLHHPLGPQFWNRVPGRWYASPYLALPAALAMIYSASGLMLVPAIREARGLLRAKELPTLLAAGVLLSPALFHMALAPTIFFFGSLRYFYVSVPGLIYLAYLYYREKLGQEAGKPRMLAKALVMLMLPAYPLHAFTLAYGMFPGIYLRDVREHMIELRAIAAEIGDGTVLVGTDKATWLSVLGGLSPSQIVNRDDDCFLEAMEEPWRYVDFVLIVRMADHPLLPAFNEVYEGRFYIYRYYYDPSWRSEFLSHFEAVLATKHYLLFALRE